MCECVCLCVSVCVTISCGDTPTVGSRAGRKAATDTAGKLRAGTASRPTCVSNPDRCSWSRHVVSSPARPCPNPRAQSILVSLQLHQPLIVLGGARDIPNPRRQHQPRIKKHRAPYLTKGWNL